MTWTPDSPPPSPDAILAQLAPEAGEGAEGYVTADDVQAALGGILSTIAATGPQVGDWTPELRTTKVAIPDIGYTDRAGWVARVGPLVYIQGFLMLWAKGTPTQQEATAYLQVWGLPYPSRAGTEMLGMVQVDAEGVTLADTKGYQVRGRLENGEAYIRLLVPGSRDIMDPLLHKDIVGSFLVHFAATYLTDAP